MANQLARPPPLAAQLAKNMAVRQKGQKERIAKGLRGQWNLDGGQGLVTCADPVWSECIADFVSRDAQSLHNAGSGFAVGSGPREFGSLPLPSTLHPPSDTDYIFAPVEHGSLSFC